MFVFVYNICCLYIFLMLRRFRFLSKSCVRVSCRVSGTISLEISFVPLEFASCMCGDPAGAPRIQFFPCFCLFRFTCFICYFTSSDLVWDRAFPIFPIVAILLICIQLRVELINSGPHLHTFSFGCALICYMDLVTNILSVFASHFS